MTPRNLVAAAAAAAVDDDDDDYDDVIAMTCLCIQFAVAVLGKRDTQSRVHLRHPQVGLGRLVSGGHSVGVHGQLFTGRPSARHGSIISLIVSFRLTFFFSMKLSVGIAGVSGGWLGRLNPPQTVF